MYVLSPGSQNTPHHNVQIYKITSHRTATIETKINEIRSKERGIAFECTFDCDVLYRSGTRFNVKTITPQKLIKPCVIVN